MGSLALSLAAQDVKWTVKDIVQQTRAGNATFSPSGQAIAWTKSRPAPEKDRFVSDLYLTRLDQPRDSGYLVVALTRSDESDRNPVFSATGDTLFFLSSRSKGKVLWGISLYGGAPFVVDSFETSLSDLARLDAHTLLFVAEEGPNLVEQQAKKEKDDVIVIEDTTQVYFKPERVFAYDLKAKQSRRLTQGRFPVRSVAASPDGQWLVTSHTRSPHYGADGKPAPAHYLWNLRSGEPQRILAEGYQTPGRFTWAKDNSGFYFASEQSSDPEWQGAGISLLHFFSLENMAPQPVPLDWELGLSYQLETLGDDALVTLANRATNKVALYEKNGDRWTRRWLEAGPYDEHLTPLAVSEDGSQLAFSYSTASTPTQYRIGALMREKKTVKLGQTRPLVKLNAHFDKKPKAQTEVVTWTGALDDEITGILYYPHNYEAGKRYPLMVAIHGGPSGVDTDKWSERWAYYPNLIAQRGAFVLMPNYHGSSNHGQAFVESIKGHYYEYELPDILNGVDHLVEKGLVNRDSMAVMGWSNGAILTTMLTVQHPELFMAAAAGAGDVNWTSDYGTCRFGVTFDQSYFGGAPWDDRDGKFYNETYITKSPLFEMEKVKTPTIIFHGSEDRAVPRDQGWEYYRALQQIGQAPVRFLWFPGQPHGLGKLTHQTRKIEEELRWFDTYFFGKTDTTNRAVKKGSPLMALLEKQKAATTNGLYGYRQNKVLLPETVTVKADSIALGRFEVTRAQWQAFRTDFTYDPAHANHPVIGISQADAQAYVQWLSEQTGDAYRLPTATEAKALHKLAHKHGRKENTLAYWAGYELTVDEVPLLKQKITADALTLFQAAGQFAPIEVGEAKLYDLAGNAAEWQQDGSSYGYSAYDFADPKDETVSPAPPHTGLRVVKEL